jgi:hypothetical protein
MGKIVFEATDPLDKVTVTREQLKTILKESKDSDVRVLSHAPSEVVEVYIGPWYNELTRHHVDEDGSVMLTETDPENDGAWE